jgi:hypothetical protein
MAWLNSFVVVLLFLVGSCANSAPCFVYLEQAHLGGRVVTQALKSEPSYCSFEHFEAFKCLSGPST